MHQRKIRSGVAAVEAAVCLPVVFIIIFGAIEISSGIFHQHVVRSAVHETAKIVSRGTSSVADAQAICAEILEQREFGPAFSAVLAIVPRGGTDTDINVDSVGPDLNDVVDTFPISFDQTSAPNIPMNVPRGTILRLTITTPRPTFGTGMMLQYMPESVVASTVFVKGI